MYPYFHYKGFFTKERTRSFVLGLIFLGLAVIFQFYASNYTTRVSSNYVNDIVLDNVPVVNLNIVIVEGALLLIAVSSVLIISRPKYILFTIKAVAVFTATRAVFIAVTHTGIYPGRFPLDSGFFDQLYMNFGLRAGYFFSGHTGMPILIGLIFWNEKKLRYFYFAAALIFGVSVLVAHEHYSIDVLAAPYMTYSVFKLCQYLFPEDFKLISDVNPL